MREVVQDMLDGYNNRVKGQEEVTLAAKLAYDVVDKLTALKEFRPAMDNLSEEQKGWLLLEIMDLINARACDFGQSDLPSCFKMPIHAKT